MSLQKISKVQNFLKEQNAEGFFITTAINIFYLTGFHTSPQERESSVLITQDKAYLFIPKMYEAPVSDLPTVKNGNVNLIVDAERDGLLKLFAKYLTSENTVLYEGNDLTVNEFNAAKSLCKNTFTEGQNFIEKLRLLKEENELENIKKAVEITDKTFNNLVHYLQNNDYTKLTELDVVDLIWKFAKQNGGTGFAFSPIVATGKGSAEPHYHPTNKKLQKGEPLLLDLGITYNHYHGDLTRNVFLGEATKEYKKMYDLVLKSNEAGIMACKTGATENEVFEASNKIFEAEKLDEYFIHGLGHGIGLEVHEAPSLRRGKDRTLENNMVVTIEPGLYFNEKFGIRIEDYVVVLENQCDVYSKASKELIEIL